MVIQFPITKFVLPYNGGIGVILASIGKLNYITPHRSLNNVFKFKKISGLGNWVKRFLGIGALVEVFCFISSLLQYQFLTQGAHTQAGANSNDLRVIVVSVVDLFVFLITMILFCVWVFRSNVNIRALGAKGFKVSPSWAVGFFFIPIFNLWKPYEAMNEVWWASHDISSWQRRKNLESNIVSRWWFVWVLSLFTENASTQLWEKAEEFSVMTNLTLLDMCVSALSIVSCYTAFVLVDQITSIQTQLEARSDSL